jgi:hypothetical protein
MALISRKGLGPFIWIPLAVRGTMSAEGSAQETPMSLAKKMLSSARSISWLLLVVTVPIFARSSPSAEQTKAASQRKRHRSTPATIEARRACVSVVEGRGTGQRNPLLSWRCFSRESFDGPSAHPRG